MIIQVSILIIAIYFETDSALRVVDWIERIDSELFWT